MKQSIQSGRVLVVEDDATLRESIVELLRIWGYGTEIAADGSEALDKIHAVEPLLIISDLEMPRMGGLELLKQLHHELRAIPFIVMTGTRNVTDEFEALTLGVSSFLEKPVYPEQLKAEIGTCLKAAAASLPVSEYPGGRTAVVH